MATILVLFLVLGNSGCLSVESVRDALLFRQDEPEVVYWKVTPAPVDVFWRADRVVPAAEQIFTEPFKVKEGAKWIKLSYDIKLPSAALGEQKILNYTYYFEPEVKMRLRKPSSEVYWERNFTLTDSNTFTIQTPSEGIWNLRIEAKGYGGEVLGLEVRDIVWVVVDLYEPK